MDKWQSNSPTTLFSRVKTEVDKSERAAEMSTRALLLARVNRCANPSTDSSLSEPSMIR